MMVVSLKLRLQRKASLSTSPIFSFDTHRTFRAVILGLNPASTSNASFGLTVSYKRPTTPCGKPLMDYSPDAQRCPQGFSVNSGMPYPI